MSDQNIFISNGTCYSAKGKELDKSFIPCGNDAFGHHTCCGAGDNCLADNACWGTHGTGYGSSLTYIAGCTDPDYADSSCPKKFFGQPWEALTRCDDHEDEWAPCSQQGDPKTLQPGSYCSCTEAAKTTIAFKDSKTLESLASLPQSAGQSIQFFAGHFPTSPSGPGSTPEPGSTTEGSGSGSNSNGAGSDSNGAGPTATGSNGSSPNGSAKGSDGSPSQGGGGGSSGLSSGTKVGIGVGVALGILVLLAVVAAFFVIRRRRRAKAEHDKRLSAASTAVPAVPEADGQPVMEADGKAARPWSMRSELEGSLPQDKSGQRPGSRSTLGEGNGEFPLRRQNLSQVAELPGSEGWTRPNT